MSLLRCATQAEELATSPHSAKKIKRRPCSHLHPPPSTITHQWHKCSGKAFLNYRGVCHSARKWNASQLQTTLERISELISCDKTSVHFDVHAGSSEIWIQSTDYDIICQGWPSPARSSQILAIKKAKLLKLLPPSISYGGPYKKNNKGAPEPTKRCLKNSDSKFFAYLFLLSHRFRSER